MREELISVVFSDDAALRIIHIMGRDAVKLVKSIRERMVERIPYCGSSSYAAWAHAAWASRDAVLDERLKMVTYRGSVSDLATDLIYALAGRPDGLLASIERLLKDGPLMARIDAFHKWEKETRKYR